MFDDLVKAILNNNSNNNNNNNNNESDSESLNKDRNENESENESENKNENESDDEQYYEIKQINNNFKKIDETKSFEDQIDILKKYHVEMNTGIRVIMKIIKRQILDYIN